MARKFIDQCIEHAGWERRWLGEEHGFITAMQFVMLEVLDAAMLAYEGGKRDTPLLSLKQSHGRTTASLIRRDLIVRVGNLHRITGRGRAVIPICRTPVTRKRNDGVCPECGCHPVHIYPSGNKAGYCRECLLESKRKQYRMRGIQRRRVYPCAMCGERKAHIANSGRIYSYCKRCLSTERRKLQLQQLERAKQGEVFICPDCKERPRHYTDNTLYGYCRDCQHRRRSSRYDKKKERAA